MRILGLLIILPLVAAGYLYSAGNNFGIDIYSFPKRSNIHKIIPSTDNTFLLLGTYFFNELNYDVFVIKLNSSGGIIWKRVIGETKTLGSFESGTDLIRRSDGTIVVLGGGRVYQLNAAGNILRKEEFHGGDVRRILSSPDGGYYMGGDTAESGNPVKRNLFLTKVNADGNIEWTRIYKHSTGALSLTFLRPVVNGYLMGGFIYGNPNTYLLKVSSAGNIIWQKKLFLPNLIPIGYTSGDKIYLVDSGSRAIGRMRVIRLSQSGEILWSREISSNDLRVEAARVGPSGSMVIAGKSMNSPTGNFLLKLSSTGTVQSLSSFPESSEIEAILTFRDHFIVLAKRFNNQTRASDTVVMKTLPSGEIPGCFTEAILPFNVLSPAVISGSSQIETQVSDATFTSVIARITHVTHTRVHLCP